MQPAFYQHFRNENILIEAWSKTKQFMEVIKTYNLGGITMITFT